MAANETAAAGEAMSLLRRWLRRIAYLLVILLWLLLMLFPIVAFLLATQGQIEVGEPNRSGLRLFMVQDSDSQGIGLQWSRAWAEAGCSQTSLRYFLWEGSAEGGNVDYCQCFDPQTGQSVPANSCVVP